MSTAVDHRLARRRHTVSEEGARRRLRRLIGLLVLVGLGSTAAWLLYHSSLLAVDRIEVGGQVESRAGEILAEQGLVPGVPTINVDTGSIEEALLADPWIAAAQVIVTWPRSVSVDVLERIPVGWVVAGETWMLAARDGVVVARAAEPDRTLPVVELPVDSVAPGETVTVAAAAALTFLDTLPPVWRRDAKVMGNGDELLARVAGHTVFLGHPSDAVEKATVLSAMLDAGVAEGAEINVVSPSRPAIKPRPSVETSREVIGESRPPG